MIRQDLNALDIRQRVQEVPRALQGSRVIGIAGHQHLPDPDGLVDFRQVAEHVQDVRVGLPRESAVGLRVDVLHIHEQEVRHLHECLELAEKRLLPRERLSRRVDAGVDAPELGLLEQVEQEIQLEQDYARLKLDQAKLANHQLIKAAAEKQNLRPPGALDTKMVEVK